MTAILECVVENIMGIDNVNLDLNGQNLTIGGKNGEGKTGLLSAILMALGGGKFIPEDPVKHGAEKGTVTLKTDEFLVTLNVKTDRSADLVVRSLDGEKLKSPQSILNAAFGKLAFEPGIFITSSEEKKIELLAEYLDIDIKSYENNEANLYQKRRDLGRDLDKQKKVFESLTEFKNVPEKVISVTKLSQELKANQEFNSNIDSKLAQLKVKQTDRKNTLKQLEELQVKLEKEEKEIKKLKKFTVVEKRPVDALVEQIANAEEINSQVNANTIKADAQVALDKVTKQHKKADGDLEKARKEYKKVLDEAKLPLKGLVIEDGKVFFNKVPFSQLSESEQWKISMSIGYGLNPKGIMIMRSMGGLDCDSREEMRKLAKKLKVQLLLEVIDTPDDVQIVIKEGKVFQDKR